MKPLLGIAVFIVGAVVLALLRTFNVQMGFVPAFVFMLVFLAIFSRVIKGGRK